MDVVVTFPFDSSESNVLWYKNQIEKIPGINLRTKSITITKGTKTKPNCFSFYLSATYHGYLQGLESMQIPKPIKEDLGGGMKEFTIREVSSTEFLISEKGTVKPLLEDALLFNSQIFGARALLFKTFKTLCN